MWINCPHCGFENKAKYRYCVRCNLPLQLRNPCGAIRSFLYPAIILGLVFLVIVYYVILGWWILLFTSFILLFFIELNRVNKRECMVDPQVQRIADEIAIKLRIPSVKVFVCENAGPFISGSVGNYCVVIPSKILSNKKALVGVLAHELSHIKNKDHIYLRIMIIEFLLSLGVIGWLIWDLCINLGFNMYGLVGYTIFGAYFVLMVYFLKRAYLAMELLADYTANSIGFKEELKTALGLFLISESSGIRIPLFKIHPTLRDRVNMIRGGVYAWNPIGGIIASLLAFLLITISLIAGILIWLLYDLSLKDTLSILMFFNTPILGLPFIYIYYVTADYICFADDPVVQNFLFNISKNIFIWMFILALFNIQSLGLYFISFNEFSYTLFTMGVGLPIIFHLLVILLTLTLFVALYIFFIGFFPILNFQISLF